MQEYNFTIYNYHFKTEKSGIISLPEPIPVNKENLTIKTLINSQEDEKQIVETSESEINFGLFANQKPIQKPKKEETPATEEPISTWKRDLEERIVSAHYTALPITESDNYLKGITFFEGDAQKLYLFVFPDSMKPAEQLIYSELNKVNSGVTKCRIYDFKTKTQIWHNKITKQEIHQLVEEMTFLRNSEVYQGLLSIQNK